jgi:curli biogenesis system outer membrane secretion channel CsgG
MENIPRYRFELAFVPSNLRRIVFPQYWAQGKAMSRLHQLMCLPIVLFGLGCSSATESHRSLQPQVVRQIDESGVKPANLAIGEFVNRSTYMNGLFADSSDRLGKQAEQILVTHLSGSRAFSVVDRRNTDALKREANYGKQPQRLGGAEFVITGAVTEFGRRETGARGLFGLLSKEKTQTLYGKVSLSIVNVHTAQVLASYQGAGEYSLTNEEILGFGSTAGYDSTLADKVLNLAMMNAVEQMRDGRRRGEW